MRRRLASILSVTLIGASGFALSACSARLGLWPADTCSIGTEASVAQAVG